MTANRIRIGGATGFWGEADLGLPQFLADGDVDYVVFDYLAEITLSIMHEHVLSMPARDTPQIGSTLLWCLISLK